MERHRFMVGLAAHYASVKFERPMTYPKADYD